MKFIQKLFIAICGTSLIGATIYLGILSGKDGKFVPLFGICAAIVAPIGLTLLGSAFSQSEGEIIQQLAKVPEIEQLIAKAKNQEEKIKVLEAQRNHLDEIVKLEFYLNLMSWKKNVFS